MIFGANTSPIPAIERTTGYSGRVIAICCIRDNIVMRVASISLSTLTDSETMVLTDSVSEDNVGIPLQAIA